MSDEQWQKQALDEQCKVIDCKAYDPIKDFRRDPTGYYVLIRPDYENKIIEVAICNKSHKIVGIFRGKKCQDVYEGIFQYEKKHGHKWFSDKGHIAYLGKELKKAEYALTRKANDYIQE